MSEFLLNTQAFGANFVWCVEHERSVETCKRLAMADYGQPFFDNCNWITDLELAAEEE
jgi:hypothetical protein